MTSKITYADFSAFLKGLGLKTWRGHRPEGATVPMPDTFLVWEHPDYSNIFLAFPDYKPQDSVHPSHIGVTRATLVLHGVLEHDDFERWRLGMTVPPANGTKKPPRKKPKAGRTNKS